MLENPALIDADPHRLFAIARLRDLPQLATKAALSTLKSDRTAKVEFSEMKILTWDHAHQLQAFHRSCGIKAKQIVEQNVSSSKWMTAGTQDLDGNVITTHFQFFVWWGAKDHGCDCGPKSETGGKITGPVPRLHCPTGRETISLAIGEYSGSGGTLPNSRRTRDNRWLSRMLRPCGARPPDLYSSAGGPNRWIE
ncbi:hypothetical protein C8J57DRAFT_1223008 [Mycena rebaudengoi]|nr:hypothetical protein C8J57DRAFT_1223008 [Mycena rebaudengoi]